jgi:hypothetical protein
MFERYTEKARRTIFFARYEASQFGSPRIESEHVLLGLLRESKALAGQVSRPSESWGELVRRQIEAHTTLREIISTAVDLPISSECQRILAYAAEEAERLSHKFIGTEHLLLGLLREPNCFAAKLLHERGVLLETARAQMITQPREEVAPVPRSPGLPAGYARHKLLYNRASEMLIVELRSFAGPHVLPTRLFARHQGTEAYEQIASPSEGVSYESPVTCEKCPIVVFNASKWNEQGQGNWAGVYAFNLNTKELEVWVSEGTLIVPEQCLRSWILELISLSDDGRKIYVNAGIERAVPGGAQAHYYLACLDVAEKSLQLLSPLKDLRF